VIDDPFVPKGQPRAPGTRTCGYKPKGAAAYCGQPGAWHVMWDGDFDNSVTCGQHMELIKRRWMYDDRHPLGADCTMPGALWLYREQRCGFDGGPLSTVAAAVALNTEDA
jgi:hypothetical protein